MKIVIGGAGAVGIHLAQLLSTEDHDVVLMDGDPVKLSQGGDADYMTIEAAPTTLNGLKSAGASSADLFVAVTPYETENITCCMLAHALGAKKTVARVDNSEYMHEQYRPLFRQMGIHSLIYPEMLAANEVVEGVKYSWVRKYWDVHNGALMLLGIKLHKDAKILNIALKDIMRQQAMAAEGHHSEQRFHIVAIKRIDETIIPNGNTMLQLGDIVYLMTKPEHLEHIRDLMGKNDYPDVSRIFVMGGSKAAVHAVNSMPDNMQLTLFDFDRERCERLNQLITNPNCIVINGDATDAQLLSSEGIERTHAFCALTNHAESNIMACLAAKRMGVRKTVALVENLEFAQLAEKLDIGTIINKKTIAASGIYREMLQANVRDIRILSMLDVDVADFKVANGAEVTKKAVMDLDLPKDVVLGGLVRNKKGLLIDGRTRIQPGDSVVVFCNTQAMAKMDEYFKSKD